jgi:hypothetical protein
MENNTTQREQSYQPKENNQNIKYIIISVIALVIAVAAYFLFKQKNKDNTTPKTSITNNILQNKDSLKDINKTDSLTTNTMEEGDEEGESFGSYVYVKNGEVLGNKQLKFGEVVYVDYQKSNDERKVIYLDNPYGKDKLPPSYTISASNLIEESSFESYKKNFSLVPFTTLPPSVKDLILENDYSNGNDYSITQNDERAKSTICYGDFDGDNLKDFAVLLDNNEKQISRLLIICTNSATQKPYIGFAENYNDKMRINSFKKGASIIIDSELQPSEMDGIILKGEDLKIGVVYDKNLQKFKTFYQE